MKYSLYFFILSISMYAQTQIETSFVNKIAFEADTIISSNNFDTTFYISDNILFKKSKDIKGLDVGYYNFQLGNITSVNTFNPLKINVFYRDFNTAAILDNRLAEMFKIDFNVIQPYRNITLVSTGFDNTLWVFNQDNQLLELFDYKTNTTRAKTLPTKGSVLDLKSNYNNCWLLTTNFLYVYNYFGSLLGKMKNDGFTGMAENNENLILKKGNQLFYIKDKIGEPTPIKLPSLNIKQFFVTNETLYIYDGNNLHQFKLIIN
ncbi:hypothetical protein KO566_07615 [Flavobacteriaceae bacterium XHP0103]|uniref:hypothetical protein n=1 Tax=Marixanthotalea marina TaxID=2844359 RepID=UPI002989AC56|nr:hypothetical protein [Marixanthotalea marina]MBU3821924.1 hypothetical protein [Marixanthotalea marina]